MFDTFCYAYFSLTNIGFEQCLSLGPLLSLYAYLCHIMLCVLRLTNISFVQCFSLGSLLSLHAYIGHVLLCVFFDLHSPSKRWLCSSCRLFLFPWICLSLMHHVKKQNDPPACLWRILNRLLTGCWLLID